MHKWCKTLGTGKEETVARSPKILEKGVQIHPPLVASDVFLHTWLKGLVHNNYILATWQQSTGSGMQQRKPGS